MTCLASLGNKTVYEEEEICDWERNPFIPLIQVVQGHRVQCTLVDCSPRIHRSFLFPDMVHAALPWGAWQCVTLPLCLCVLQRGLNLQPSPPPAVCKPSGLLLSQLPLFVNTLYDAVSTNYILVRLPCTAEREPCTWEFILLQHRFVDYTSMSNNQIWLVPP